MSGLDTAPQNIPLQPKELSVQFSQTEGPAFLIKEIKCHVSGVPPHLTLGGLSQEQPEA